MNRTLGIVLQTIFEAAGLIVWLALIMSAIGVIADGGGLFEFAKYLGLSVLVLFLGFELEHLVAYYFLVSSKLPVGRLTVLSISETIIWIAWFYISSGFAHAVGFVFLTVTMFVQHSLELRVFKGLPILDFDEFSFFFNSRVALHTLIESAGAQIWLALVFTGSATLGVVGAVVLVVTLAVEHVRQAKL